MKRRRGQPFLGTEPHNALPTGLLAFNRFLPMPPPIRVSVFRHRLVLPNALDESYPGIQLTTARKAGDLLTLTHSQHVGRPAIAVAASRPMGPTPPGQAGVSAPPTN